MSDATFLFVIAALMVVFTYIAMWVAYILVRYEPAQWWLRLMDPDSYPSIPWREAFGEAIRWRLDRQTPAAKSPAVSKVESIRGYQIDETLGSDELSNVFLARRQDAPADRFILKVSRTPATERRLQLEHDLLKRLQTSEECEVYGRYFPRPMEAFHHDGQLITVCQSDAGFCDLTQIRKLSPDGVEARHVAWMFNRTLEALGYVHQLHLVHGAVLPPHLLFHPANHGLHLIGWTHAVPIGRPIRLAPKGYESWYPSGCNQTKRATPAVDIHLAALSMLWIAGEDVDSSPRRLPVSIHRFLNRCLYPSRVTLGAWALHAQFRELLEEAFGPPRFCPFPTWGAHTVKGESDGNHMLV